MNELPDNVETTDNEWKHPTGNSPQRIAIVGLGPSFKDFIHTQITHDPMVRPYDEVWTLNTGLRTFQWDLGFVMDDLVGEAKKAKRYAEDIRKFSDQKPVLTSRKDAEVERSWPNVLEYPLAHVLAWWGARLTHIRTGKDTFSAAEALNAGLKYDAYFTNSIPYLLAYAGMIGVHEISLWGVDYTYDGNPNREEGRACAEYWVSALLHGLGVHFEFPSTTTLLDKNKPLTFYGFNARQPF